MQSVVLSRVNPIDWHVVNEARLTRHLRAPSGRPSRTDFLNFVQKLTSAGKTLGLTHVTNSYVLREIVETGRVEPSLCKVLGESVIYAFYGRVAFRDTSEFQPTNLSSLFPSVLVFDPHKLPKAKYVFPFDSGAFMDGMMDQFLHPYMPLFDFALLPDISSAANLVKAMFGDAKSYFENTPSSDLIVAPSNFEADSYIKIVFANSRTNASNLDERASTPECLFAEVLELKKCVSAIVLPDTLANDPTIRSAIEACNVEIHEYPWTRGSRPNENHFVVQNLIRSIYEQRGWL